MISALPIAGTIAGSDSGAGAGIQGDLKTFAALRTYGVSVVVAVTAQNTLGVRAVEVVSPAIVTAQIEALVADLPPEAWKTGMLGSAAVVRAVVAGLAGEPRLRLVVDPVITSTSGAALLDEEGLAALRHRLLPLALVATPNRAEAAALVGGPVRTPAEIVAAARAIAAMGPRVVVVTGGDGAGPEITDTIVDTVAGTVDELSAQRIKGHATHGTGCALSAAITAHLAHGAAPGDAVRRARGYVQEALRRAPGLGAGRGPLGHLPPPR